MKTGNSEKNGLRLPALGLGCWPFGGGEYWGERRQDEVDRTVRRAVDLGVNYFDTAEAYNEGRSEESLGIAIRGLAREKLIVGTKLIPSNGRANAVVEHCDASLRRLKSDYIDLYMVHWPMLPHAVDHFSKNGDCPSAAEVFPALDKLRRQGKIRHIGVSNFGIEVLEEARATGVEIAVNELPYNLLCRAIEREVLPHCRRIGVAVIGYMALMQGLLADIYPTLDDVPRWQGRTRHFSPARAGQLCRHGEAGAEAESNAALAAIRAIARREGKTMPEIAIQWAVAGEGIACALVGAGNEQKVEANVRAAAAPLAPAVVAELNAATQPLLRKLGPSFDYYEHTDRDRTRPLPSAVNVATAAAHDSRSRRRA